MADIDVVKKGSRTWLWMLIAALVVIGMFFLMGRDKAPRTGSRIEEGGRPNAAVFHSLGEVAEAC